MKNKKPFMVILTEHERGWGQKPFHTEYFDSMKEAKAYSTNENAQNNLPEVPDWYVTASAPMANPDAE